MAPHDHVDLRAPDGAAKRVPGVLLALHGHDDHPSTARNWGRRVAPIGWDVVALDAGIDAGGTRSWFPSGPRGVDTVALGATIDRVESAVVDARSRASRVAVAGFSQGGAVALAMAWRGTSADQVVSMCGFFPETDEPLERSTAHDPDILVLGTTDDAEVPSFMSVDAASMFDAAGFRTRSHVLEGGHHVDADMAATASAFLSVDAGRRPYFSLALPVDRVEPASEFTSAPAITELAAAYEGLGFHAAYVTDHPAPDTRWLAGGGHQALDPVGALAVAAGATNTLRLHTNVYVLPYRNPFLAAKALSTLDVISEGRLIAGVAAGYLRPEFGALGAEFDDRGPVLEESLSLLPSIWAGRTIEARGSGWESRSTLSLPATHGGPPLWIGGNSRAATRRAVTMAQGWSPMPTPPGSAGVLRTTEMTNADQLGRRLVEARELCERTSRTAPLTICFVPFTLGAYMADPVAGLAPMVDEIADLFERGVDWFPLMVPGDSRSVVIDNAAKLADALEIDQG